MTITFTVGSLPSQIPVGDFIQDSMFGGICEVVSVVYAGNPLQTAYYSHEPAEWRLYFGDSTNEGDEIQVTVNKLGCN